MAMHEVLIACGECDLLLKALPAEAGSKVRCPRCGHVLAHPQKNSLETCLALSLAGLLLFVPANFLPILTLSVLGKTQTETMVSGVSALYRGGLWWVALLVALCSVVVPLGKLLLMFYVSACLKLGRFPDNLGRSFRCYHQLDTWGMLEVYMLGILVAVVKLKDMADVVP
ncbi:MAG: paraquat-inducible protein A, partial [Pseudomonadota bacterium]